MIKEFEIYVKIIIKKKVYTINSVFQNKNKKSIVSRCCATNSQNCDELKLFIPFCQHNEKGLRLQLFLEVFRYGPKWPHQTLWRSRPTSSKISQFPE